MSDPLSPQTEQFITDALAAGRFVSRSELLEAAVVQLREELRSLDELQAPEELVESLRLCDEAIDDIEAGRGIEMTPQVWDEMRDEVRKFAAERTDLR